MIIIEGIQNFLSPTSRGSIRRAHRKAKFHRGDPIFLANNCLTRVSLEQSMLTALSPTSHSSLILLSTFVFDIILWNHHQHH